MPDAAFKYRINELLYKLPVTDYRKAIRIIPKQLNISQKTFANYRNIKLNTKQDIPHEKVVLLEIIFALQPGQLQNYTLTIKPINELIDIEPF
jgi:hypothetical protein